MVSVAADTCLEADGWDTPLLVMGPERGVECAERHGIAAMFIEHRAGDELREGGDVATMTSAWLQRIGKDFNGRTDSRKGAKAQSNQ
jgi:hypothetical protein